GGGGGGGSTGSTASSAITTPLTGPEIGGPSGFESTAQVIEQIGVYASPWEIDVLSICALSPGCQEVLLGAAGVAAEGVLVYKDVQAGVQIYQSRRVAPNQAENAQVDRVAREFCVDRTALGDKVHEYKRNLPKGYRLSEEELEMLARELPKTPGCVPTRE
ncbi:MAG: hypothetical protein ACRD2G_12435, partial [Terriglobia bacterium]